MCVQPGMRRGGDAAQAEPQPCGRRMDGCAADLGKAGRGQHGDTLHWTPTAVDVMRKLQWSAKVPYRPRHAVDQWLRRDLGKPGQMPLLVSEMLHHSGSYVTEPRDFRG